MSTTTQSNASVASRYSVKIESCPSTSAPPARIFANWRRSGPSLTATTVSKATSSPTGCAAYPSSKNGRPSGRSSSRTTLKTQYPLLVSLKHPKLYRHNANSPRQRVDVPVPEPAPPPRSLELLCPLRELHACAPPAHSSAPHRRARHVVIRLRAQR